MKKQMGTHAWDKIGCGMNANFGFILFYSFKSTFHKRRKNRSRQLLNPYVTGLCKLLSWTIV